MKEYKHETQLTPDIKGRMVGYVLVEDNQTDSLKSKNIINSGIQRFFGGFGNNVYLKNLGKYKLALLLPEQIHKLECVSLYSHEDNFAFIEGSFTDFDLLRKCRQQENIVNESLAAEILDNILNNNFESLKMINGRYSGFVYLAQEDKLILFTDQYGANRVFIYNHNDTFAVSNNVFALSTNPYLSVSVDEESVAHILEIEYPALRGTEFAEISLVLPSDVYIRTHKSVTYQKYYQQIDRTRAKNNAQYIKNLAETLDNFTKEFYNYYNETVGLFLSKGKDSRLFLPFLESNHIPYQPFVFKDGTGVFDYPYVKELAQLLDKDLHVLEHYTIDKRMAYLISMNTSPTLSWFAMAEVAQQYTSATLMGLLGDNCSGKTPSFRNFGMRNRKQVAESYFKMATHGVGDNIISQWTPYYSKFNAKEAYLKLFEDYPESKILFDAEIYHDFDFRSFRNELPILLRASHFISVVAPFIDNDITKAYHSLPEALVSSQKAHAKIGAMETKSNKIQSTAFPISLKLESKIRPAMNLIIKLNNLLDNRLLLWQRKKFNNYVTTDIFVPRSDYFKNVFGNQNPIKVGHPYLLLRLYNLDNYLHLVFHDDILPLCKKPHIVINELN